MEIKIAKGREPELKLKREAEVSIHKKELISPKKGSGSSIRVKSGTDIPGIRNHAEADGEENSRTADNRRMQEEQTFRKSTVTGKKSSKDSSRALSGKVAYAPVGKTITGGKNSINTCQYQKMAVWKTSVKEKRSKESGKGMDSILQMTGNLPVDGSAGCCNSSVSDVKQAEIRPGEQAGEKYLRFGKLKAPVEAPKKQPAKTTVMKGVKRGGAAVLTQMDGGEEVNEALSIMETANSLRYVFSEKRKYAKEEKKLKIRRTNEKITDRQFGKKLKKSKRSIGKQQQNKAIRQRKLQYMINKLTGSKDQDSAAQTVKDIVRMKASCALMKAVKHVGVILAPLFGMLFLAAFPVVLIVLLFYCSPLAAFMENPVSDTPSIQEVLGGYYMEFNQEVSTNAGENGSITYLHDGESFVSNYMDTLMVYMVRYGTGDLGIVMDEEHKGLLKEIFDEMNSYEDTTVTTAIQAGQSLGNVVTSGYCSCSICCGRWAGGPTASGAMPTADHTLAVDASDPFVPLGTKIIMNGTEYVVEDTGNLNRYGVQFDVYFADHEDALQWGHTTLEAFLADGDENTISVTKKGSYVKNLNYEDYIALGILTADQTELLQEVMSEEFRSELPSIGAENGIAALALTKVGCRYSQDRRYEEGFYDCSSLVQRCCAEAGISFPGTSSGQGQYVVEHGLEVTEDMLQPGDLIFYSHENNGEFLNISNVAIYVGNGRMVHAANTARGVVNDPFSPSNIGLYGRPGAVE